MRTQRSAPSAVKSGTLLSLGLAALAFSGAATVEAAQEGAETYTWSAELVEFDEANRAATVKARIVGDPENVQTDALSEGDRAMLTWSGITYGAGIRAIEPGDESSFDRMSMPVEFVAEDNGHLVFRVQVPAENAAAIAALDAGQWVTATSPHQPSDASEAVVAMRPYTHVE
jgi:hypothetical protein